MAANNLQYTRKQPELISLSAIVSSLQGMESEEDRASMEAKGQTAGPCLDSLPTWERDIWVIRKHYQNYQWMRIFKEMQFCVETTMNLRIECDVSSIVILKHLVSPEKRSETYFALVN